MKRIITILTTACMVMLMAVTGFAAPYTESGTVEFNGKELTEDFQPGLKKITDSIEPGDSAEITVTLINNGSDDTDWYMSSKIIDSFEQTSQASKGAYSYLLTYGDEEIYKSRTVGGDGSVKGLGDVEMLEDSFYLGTLKAGETATVKLSIGLDGETLDNSYMDAEASLEMGFAVTDTAHPKTIHRTVTVNTGNADYTWIYKTLAVIAATCLGAVLICAKYDRKEEEQND